MADIKNANEKVENKTPEAGPASADSKTFAPKAPEKAKHVEVPLKDSSMETRKSI